MIDSFWKRTEHRFFGLLYGDKGCGSSGCTSVSEADDCCAASRSGILTIVSVSDSEFSGADGASVSDCPDYSDPEVSVSIGSVPSLGNLSEISVLAWLKLVRRISWV